MESRRTPNHPKPIGTQQKSTGSRSKFAAPRSHRKQDANTTISGFKNSNASVMGPSRALNYTVRQNFNLTLSAAAYPNIKSNINPSANDTELEYDLAYNDYLQALIKQQLVEKTIEQHEIKLNNQMLIQNVNLHKLELTFKDILNKIENLKEQSDIIELLQTLKYGVSEIEVLCSRYNTYTQLNELNKILMKESNAVSTRNIKPLNSQEEYDKLISSLSRLKCVMEKIIKADKKFKEVNELSSCIKTFTNLNDTITAITQKLGTSNKKVAALVLNQASDFFAQQGGYF